MARDDVQLKAAKRSYKQASIIGNHQEEARWANVIGDILKQRGEYVEALRWLRIDYDISRKHLPEKQLLPTCQSLGEVYLRLQHFEQALLYQKKHLELAKDANDLVEQQRASTQLGRTYHELFCRSENDHYAVRKAKKYFLLAMELARDLKESPPPHKSSFFLKEFIDAHNNLGMLEMDMDNLDEAKKYLLKGLKICNDEEVIEDDDARSRLHHNLGSLYIELRAWDKAREHIERDILICKKISHPQGEAKGYINLGELHYRVQKYDEAILCYQKALDIARPMEDEDALVEQINQNIKTVNEAAKVLEELRKEELVLKRLTRTTVTARGTTNERRCLLQQDVSLDRLIEKSRMIFAWTKHREYAKRKKRVTSELFDKEKLSDSFLAIGESYQKLRNFNKAHKWYLKSWNVYRSIGNVEGQALTKINIGEVLDSAGDWSGALEAFKEGNRIAAQGNLVSVQISALENMHYSYMIRFDNVEEARKLHSKIQALKHLLNNEDEVKNMAKECCSETETEGGGLSDNGSDACDSLRINSPVSRGMNKPSVEFTDDLCPVTLLPPIKKSKTNMRQFCGKMTTTTGEITKASSEEIDNQQLVGRKRIRVVLSDDEVDEHDLTDNSSGRIHTKCPEDNRVDKKYEPQNSSAGFQDVSRTNAPKDVREACTTIHLEESTSSFKPDSPNYKAGNVTDFKSSSAGEFASASKSAASGSKSHGGLVLDNVLQCQNDVLFCSEHQYNDSIPLRIGDDLIHVEPRSCLDGKELSIECLKAEVARIWYLHLSDEKRSKGLLPIIRCLKCGGKAIESPESLEDFKDFVGGEGWIEVVIDGWFQKRLMKLYVDHCEKLSEAPNAKLLMKLYYLEVTEDEIIASDCGLQDISISPFLDALCDLKTIATLDLSHNSLGNETMLKLKQIFSSASQKYRGLTLDLHCNRFGPTALFQICECPELFSRLEVLNLSGNRLTDSCGSYLSNILDNCRALYSLNIEQCSITSRTIQKVSDALNADSVLAELSIGRNNPISGNAMCNLMSKLATLKRFSEINLSGVKLSKPTVDSLCQLAKLSNLSALMLGSTYIGDDGVVHLTEALSRGPQELVKLDLSCCGLTFQSIKRIHENIVLAGSVLELNLGGNSILQEGSNALASLLVNPQCCLKVLVLNKCHLGLTGVLEIIQALAVAENNSLEELNLAENADLGKGRTMSMPKHGSLNSSLIDDIPTKICAPEEVKAAQQGLCTTNSDEYTLDVAYAEHNPIRDRPTLSASSDSTKLSERKGVTECQLIQDLSVAIGSTKQLQLLDLSFNGFSEEVAGILHSAWVSSSCGRLVQKHIDVNTIHFSVEGKNCCGVRTCCKRY